MQLKLRWKKSPLSDLYRIYDNGEQIGKLKNRTFSQTAVGDLHGREYTFRTKGFFKQHTEIIDSSESRVIGEIRYNSWMTKANITSDNKTINWKYDNLWNTRWSIFNSEGIKIQYSGSSTNGHIDSNTDDSMLLLSGLYVTNYYWQMTLAILLVVFIPLWLNILR